MLSEIARFIVRGDITGNTPVAIGRNDNMLFFQLLPCAYPIRASEMDIKSCKKRSIFAIFWLVLRLLLMVLCPFCYHVPIGLWYGVPVVRFMFSIDCLAAGGDIASCFGRWDAIPRVVGLSV